MNHRKAKGPTPPPGRKAPQTLRCLSQLKCPDASSQTLVYQDQKPAIAKDPVLDVVLLRLETDLREVDRLHSWYTERLHELENIGFFLEGYRARLLQFRQEGGIPSTDQPDGEK